MWPLLPYRYYVYALLRPDDTPFYFGKGTVLRGRYHSRPTSHIAKAKNGEISYRANVIRKILAEGDTIGVAIVFTTNDESMAFAEECRLITSTKNLTNQTTGGEGYSQSPEVIAKRVALITGKKHSNETRQRMSDTAKARGAYPNLKQTAEKLEIVRKTLTGLKRSEDTIAKLSGSKNHHSKFKEDDIPIIRDRYKRGETLKSIAQDYNVSYTTIQKIISRESWDHVY